MSAMIDRHRGSPRRRVQGTGSIVPSAPDAPCHKSLGNPPREDGVSLNRSDDILDCSTFLSNLQGNALLAGRIQLLAYQKLSLVPLRRPDTMLKY